MLRRGVYYVVDLAAGLARDGCRFHRLSVEGQRGDRNVHFRAVGGRRGHVGRQPEVVVTFGEVDRRGERHGDGFCIYLDFTDGYGLVGAETAGVSGAVQRGFGPLGCAPVEIQAESRESHGRFGVLGYDIKFEYGATGVAGCQPVGGCGGNVCAAQRHGLRSEELHHGVPSVLGNSGLGRERYGQRSVGRSGAGAVFCFLEECGQYVVGIDFRPVVDYEYVVKSGGGGVEESEHREVDHDFPFSAVGGAESDDPVFLFEVFSVGASRVIEKNLAPLLDCVGAVAVVRGHEDQGGDIYDSLFPAADCWGYGGSGAYVGEAHCGRGIEGGFLPDVGFYGQAVVTVGERAVKGVGICGAVDFRGRLNQRGAMIEPYILQGARVISQAETQRCRAEGIEQTLRGDIQRA